MNAQHVLFKHSLTSAITFHFFLRDFLTAAARFFLATMSLKRSKSFISDLAFFALIFFAQAVFSQFAIMLSFCKASFNVFSRAPRGIVDLKSVKLRQRMGIMCLRTPVIFSGPSTTTRFWSTISTIVHILPAHGP